MTRSEKLLWYRNNGKEEIEEDRSRVRQSSNYKQLELLRGNGVLGREDWDDTRSKRLTWFRNGGSEVVEREKDLARQCSNWQQFHLLSRGSSALNKFQEEGETEDAPTRSEALLWYRNGGREVVEDTKTMASNSENWMQYKLTRDASKHANQLYNAVQDSYSEFKSKAALSDYMNKLRVEGMEEREEIREFSRTRNVRDSMTKTAFDIHVQPYYGLELEESASRKLQYKMKMDALQEDLRCTTESMLMTKTQYMQTAREMALQAYKEDMAAVAASRMSRKTTVVQQNQAVSTVA